MTPEDYDPPEWWGVLTDEAMDAMAHDEKLFASAPAQGDNEGDKQLLKETEPCTTN